MKLHTLTIFSLHLVVGILAKTNKKPWTNMAARRAQQQGTAEECGEILGTWTASEAYSIIEAGIDRGLGPAGEDLKSLALPLIKYGVQVRKVCAACADFMLDCTKNYGGDVTNSGLLMIPLQQEDNDNNTTSIAAGTHKAIIYCHGTRAVAQPSTDWDGENSGIEIILNMLYTATARTVGIMPDYMGQGESFGNIFRGYIVRESYETSVVPLYLQAGSILEQETDCTSAVADAVFVMGYSEGGYAAVSVAEKLSSAMGINIIRVDAGGAPFWVSSGTFVSIVQFVNNGTFPGDVRFYLAYLGFSFSSSRNDMPNFESGQDMLTSDARQSMLEFLASDLPDTEDEGIEAANSLVPVDDKLSIYDPDFIDFIQSALADNDTDPCTNQPIEGTNDLLCQSLQAQDIHEVLQNVSYPVVVCHSPDDEIVSFLNVPDLSLSTNPNLSLLQVSGTHEEAGGTCFVSSTAFILSNKFMEYNVTDKTKESCQQQPSSDGVFLHGTAWLVISTLAVLVLF